MSKLQSPEPICQRWFWFSKHLSRKDMESDHQRALSFRSLNSPFESHQSSPVHHQFLDSRIN